MDYLAQAEASYRKGKSALARKQEMDASGGQDAAAIKHGEKLQDDIAIIVRKAIQELQQLAVMVKEEEERFRSTAIVLDSGARELSNPDTAQQREELVHAARSAKDNSQCRANDFQKIQSYIGELQGGSGPQGGNWASSKYRDSQYTRGHPTYDFSTIIEIKPNLESLVSTSTEVRGHSGITSLIEEYLMPSGDYALQVHEAEVEDNRRRLERQSFDLANQQYHYIKENLRSRRAPWMAYTGIDELCKGLYWGTDYPKEEE